MRVFKLHSSKDLKYYCNLLINSGIKKDQANVLIDAIKHMDRAKDSAFATIYDIKKLHYQIERLEMKLIIKLGAMMAFWSSIIISLIKLK